MLIEALQNRTLYDHPVEDFHIVETHISWVLLTGPYAYKIKKPVNLGFLDFSTLAKRRHFCHEELRLNRRLAPQLYISVVPITGSIDEPRLDGPGTVIEYAVKMLQFPGDAELERVLERGQLEIRHIETLAARIAAFHRSIPTAAAESDYGLPQRVWNPVEDNFNHIRSLIKTPEFDPVLSALHEWSKDNFTALQRRISARRQDGFVRECHGDMHLGNMILLDDEIIVFDCLEFNPALRWIDVMSEVAFLTMDLDDRHQSRLGWRFLNHYLENTGDYEGLDLLRFYQAYRAMVRAKVTAIRLGQGGLDERSANIERLRLATYLELAQGYTRGVQPALMITHGFSGAGKSLLTSPLADLLPAVRIRSDVERKRLFGLVAADHSGRSDQAQGGQLYSANASRRTYERLAELAANLLRFGFSVIVDATFLRQEERRRFRTIAEDCSVPFIILDFQAPETLLRKWVARRMESGQDASDAGIQILEYQMSHHDPLSDEEQPLALVIDTAHHVDEVTLCQTVREHIEELETVSAP